MARLTIARDRTGVSAAAAERITSLIEASMADRRAVALGLAGGETPRQLYEYLADPDRPWRARIDWAHVELFWSDERNVPPDHPESNFGLANRTLIQHVPIPASHVHRMRGERPAVDAAREYDALLRARRSHTRGPLFDVMLLGIGADAHIASLFPESPLLLRGPKGSAPLADNVPCGADNRPSGADNRASGANNRPSGADNPSCGADLSGPRAELAAGIWVPKLVQWRITLTPPALLDARAIVVIAAGPTKADAVAAALEGDLDVARYPAQLLREAGDRVEWILDAGAGRLVSL